jgi:hypothetical protein
MAEKYSLYTAQTTTGFKREAIYNALDTITTLEIDNVLDAQMDAGDRRAMNFYLAAQAAAFDMTMRGMKVNPVSHAELLNRLKKDKLKLERSLAKHPQIVPIWDNLEKETGACAVPSRKDGKHVWEKGVPDTPERKCTACGASRFKVRPFKPSSPADIKHLLYDLLKLKVMRDKDGKVTTDKEARDKLRNKYKQYADLITDLDNFADYAKQVGFLNFRSRDGRWHSSFNVSVTSTGRWSSNKDAYGDGGNSQNITEQHRYIFEADPGMEFCYADLKQAESNVIAHVAGDPEYIEAHAGGDTHTYVCRLVWPEGINGQEWDWKDIKKDKKLAKSANPTWDKIPGHDYRFQSKAVQHGSNLGLTAFGLAIQKHIPVEAARDAQRRYFRAFPGILAYQNMIREKVQAQEPIVTPLGIKFKLFGRPWDEHTYKEGLAIIPQSTVGHIIAIGIIRTYRKLPEVQLLAQVHDAILFQFPKGRYDLVHKVLQEMQVPVTVTGVDGVTRTIIIGTEAAVGLNWAHHSDDNPDGLREIEFKSPTEWSIE